MHDDSKRPDQETGDEPTPESESRKGAEATREVEPEAGVEPSAKADAPSPDRDQLLDEIIAGGEATDEVPDEDAAAAVEPEPASTSTPPPPPAERPPVQPEPVTPPPAAGGRTSEGTLMLILAYLGPFALVPYLMQPADSEQRFHARQGLALFLTELFVGIGFAVLLHVPILGAIIGCLGCVGVPLAMMVLLFVHAGLIFKALDGDRMELPLVGALARLL